MRIAVCIQQVLDVTGPFRITDQMEALDQELLIPIANPADLAGLSLVRQVVSNDTAHITALTVGPASSEESLRKCLSIGAEEAIRVWDQNIAKVEHDADAIARILAATAKKLGFDLIVCGSRGLEGGSGYVGPAIAEYLGVPSIGSVSYLELPAGQKQIICHRRLEHGDREVISCDLPTVLTVDVGAVEIPYASMPALIAASSKDITIMDGEAIGYDQSQIKSGNGKFQYYIPPKPRTKKRAQSSAALTPAQKMQQMMGGGAKQGGNNVVEGDPQKAATEIIKFMESKGVLAP